MRCICFQQSDFDQIAEACEQVKKSKDQTAQKVAHSVADSPLRDVFVEEYKETAAYPMSGILAGQAKIVLKRGLPIRGTVRDETGKPISGVRIFFDDPSMRKAPPTTTRTTDSEGRYEVKSWFRNRPPLALDPQYHRICPMLPVVPKSMPVYQGTV